MIKVRYLEPYGTDRWERAHQAKSAGALSGSDPRDVLRQHCLQEIRPGTVVLDIGVGLGGMSEQLHKMGCVVDALDVAPTAGETVREWTRNFYLAPNIETLSTGEYDFAISQIVSQHMHEAELMEQVTHVFRAIKPHGVFSLHMAGSSDEKRTPNNLTGLIPKGMDGAMCRTPEYALGLIKRATDGDAHARIVGKRMDWPQFGSYWYFVHITKERSNG